MSESNNKYNNHKVVAIPVAPFDPTSYQQKQSSDDASAASSYQSRLRSRRLGGSISRSRDIVQDVYDRMGVNYVRGRPSIEALLQDTGLVDTPKHTGQDFSVEVNSGHQDSRRRINGQLPPLSPRSTENEDHHTRAQSTEFSVPGLKDRNDRRSMTLASLRSFSRKNTADQRDEQGRNVDLHAPDDERDEGSIASAKTSKSVRERASLFGTTIRAGIGGSSRSNVRHSYGGASNVRSHPPKINIYDSTSVGNGGAKDGTCVSVDASRGVDHSSCIGGTAGTSGAISVSRRSVGEAFLAAINKKSNTGFSPMHISKNIAVVEIPSNDAQGNENASVASSVSGDDFIATPRQNGGKYVQTTNATPFDKQINECVQDHISMLTRRFDADIRRIENRINEECAARIAALERRNDELTALLEKAGIFA